MKEKEYVTIPKDEYDNLKETMKDYERLLNQEKERLIKERDALMIDYQTRETMSIIIAGMKGL